MTQVAYWLYPWPQRYGLDFGMYTHPLSSPLTPSDTWTKFKGGYIYILDLEWQKNSISECSIPAVYWTPENGCKERKPLLTMKEERKGDGTFIVRPFSDWTFTEVFDELGGKRGIYFPLSPPHTSRFPFNIYTTTLYILVYLQKW